MKSDLIVVAGGGLIGGHLVRDHQHPLRPSSHAASGINVSGKSKTSLLI
jgi:hypothetical protein